MNSEIDDTKNIRASMIIEVLGKPADHVLETLQNLVKQIGEEKSVVIKDSKINEPKELEGKQAGFFASFAEVEIEVEEMMHLVLIVFKYMPSHVEIIKPELIALTNNSWADILTNITQKLHAYDEIARILQIEKQILEKKLRELLEQQGGQNRQQESQMSISMGGEEEKLGGERVEQKEENVEEEKE